MKEKRTHGWAMKEPLALSHRKGQTPNCTTANFSAESFTLRYRTSERSNSNASLHGALVMPVISRSMATKSASRTRTRRSSSAGSKLDFVTFFTATPVEAAAVAEEEKRRQWTGREQARVRVLEKAETRHRLLISAAFPFKTPERRMIGRKRDPAADAV